MALRQENRYRRFDTYYFRTFPEVREKLYKIADAEQLPVNVVLENIITGFYEDYKRGLKKGELRC